MNRKELELIQMAFGELDHEQARALESEIAGDETLRSSVSEYQSMREGLKAMQDVPEMQLSRERLRDALLKDGLKKPKAGFPWWAMSWLPAGAAAVWVATILMRQPIQTMPLIVAPNPEPSTTVALRMPNFDEPKLTRSVFYPATHAMVSGADFGESSIHETRSTDLPVSSEPRLRIRTKVASPPSVSMLPKDVKHLEFDPADSSINMSPELSPASQPVEPAPVADQGDGEPLVMIQSEEDARTGVPIATEVRADANIIVGG